MLKAMVVDDDRNTCQGLARLIPWRELGYEMTGFALNGEEGYKMAVEREPDVIISDIVMPIFDGTAFCQKIMDTMSGVSFIFISAHEDFASAQIGMRKSVYAYITKPMTRDKLEYMKTCLREIRDRKEMREFFNEILFSEGFEQRLFDMLDGKAGGEIDAILRRIADAALSNTDESGRVQEVCLKMLHFLNKYLKAQPPFKNYALYTAQTEAVGRMKLRRDMIDSTRAAFEEALSQLRSSAESIDFSASESIREYIDRHYGDPQLNCAQLAAQYHYSANYISRLFTAAFHMSPGAYLIKTRIEAACRLLTQTDLSITEIGERTGFLNSNYFAKAFRRETGLSPSRYRLVYTPRGQ